MLTKQIMIFGGRDERRLLIESNASFVVRLVAARSLARSLARGHYLRKPFSTRKHMRANEREGERERIVCCVSALTGREPHLFRG